MKLMSLMKMSILELIGKFIVVWCALKMIIRIKKKDLIMKLRTLHKPTKVIKEKTLYSRKGRNRRRDKNEQED
jgi:hypothetical protein